MFHRLILTLATAVSLTGMSAIYSIAMRPIVVIPNPQEIIRNDDYTEVQRPAENARVAAKYIPSRIWAAASKYMLRVEEAFIYTDSCNPDKENNRRVRFQPFAIVWLTKDNGGNEQAISVVCDSATLEFASKFDEKNPSPGRIVGAVLNGAVEIAGPDGLLAQGSEFHFEEAGLTLYTHNRVGFQYQSHQGSATRMEMKLIPAEGPPGVDRPHVYGIESIHLSGKPSRNDPTNQYVKLKMLVPQGEETRLIKARCSGELTYTVATHTAVLTTDVFVRTGTTPFDQLECDQLTMQFIPKALGPNGVGATTSTATPSLTTKQGDEPGVNEYQKIETNLEFRSVEALGVEGAPVKIRSPSNGVVARMARFTYSEESRTVIMSSENSPNDVVVVRNGSMLQVPQIEAQLDELKKNVTSLVCLGAGEVKYFDEQSGRLTYAAKWLNELRRNRDVTTNLDLVELDGGAQFRQPKPDARDSSGLVADQIKIWLAPVDFTLPSAGDGASASSKTPEPRPKRLLAQKNVALVSPRMLIKKTDELDIRFDDELDSTPAMVSTSNRSKNKTGKNGVIGFASIPTTPLGSLGPPVEIPFDEPPQRQPIERTFVSAERISVRMRRVAGSQEFQPRAVRSEGKVEITQERKTGEKPLRLEGDHVDLQIESQQRLVAHVHGTPAVIRDRQFDIEGKDLHFDRAANRAWVAGSGVLSVPLPADTKILGMETTSHRDLIVRWNESMQFDGLNAKFLGSVKAELGLAKMTCEQMDVQLVDRISFQDEHFDTEPSLKTIRCHENVQFMNSTHQDKKLVEVYRGHVGDFTLNYPSGTVDAQGPGEIFAWRRQQKGQGVSQRDTIQANRPVPTEVTVWDYTQVRFEGRLKGHFDGQATGHATHQRVTIADRVEVVYGPVKDPTAKVDPDKLPSMAGSMRCDQLQFVNHPVSERTPIAFREIVGQGNSEIEGQARGRRFTASADEISFDESKGLYLLRAHGQQYARLTGIGTGNLIGRRIEFNPDPKLRILKVDRAIEGQGSQ